MKLRARLALTLGLATVAVWMLLGWSQSRWHSRLRVEALAEAATNRMESGGRERCEDDPAHWPGSPRDAPARPHRGRGHRRLPPHRVFAYGADFQSFHPDAPPFPRELSRQLQAGERVAAQSANDRRLAQVGVRMPWNEGPCSVLLIRAKGPPRWFSGPVLMPALLVSAAVILVALFAAGPIVARVRQLTEAVRKLGSNSSEPIHVEGTDEIAELGAAFEHSRQTIQAQIESLRERERTLRNYISNTTHDVMLPLSVLQGHLVSLQQRIEAGRASRSPRGPRSSRAPRSQRARRTGRRSPPSDCDTQENRAQRRRTRDDDRIPGRPHPARASAR